MTKHDLGDGYEVIVTPVYGRFRAHLRLACSIVAHMDGLANSHSKAVSWGVKAKRDHRRALELAANPRRSWRQRFFG